MHIIAGTARNTVLAVPPGIGVRPTAGRARKALFDSIGYRIPDSAVLDLCAGSGALGLECASRKALSITLIESNLQHLSVIEENIARVKKCGVNCEFFVIGANVELIADYIEKIPVPNLIFADPPYSKSAEMFKHLIGDERFCTFVAGALLIWEIPDSPGSVGEFINSPRLVDSQIRRFGGTDFLLGEIQI
ncbi:MAG: RsmD family RNA methyltransferase [Victivallales bacterium]|jgi:16S rRNA (guanine966-N2)-methyltransferase|nr:RsmD family RNA methyltransferase [Victivallales bacterium]